MSELDLERYRRRAEEFVGALDLEYYEHFSGRKPRCDTAAVYDRYPELFTREAIDGLEAIYAEATGDEKLRLAYLLAFTVDGFMGEQTKHLGDEIANTEGETTITVDGETIGLRQAASSRATSRTGRVGNASRRRASQPPPSGSTRSSTGSGDAVTSSPSSSATRTTRSSTARCGAWTTTTCAPSSRAFSPTPTASTSGSWTGSCVSASASRSRSSATPTCRVCGAPRASTACSRRDAPHPVAATLRSQVWASTSTPSPTCTSTPRSASSSRRVPSVHLCACRTRSTSSCCRTAARTTTAASCTRPGTRSTSRTCVPTLPSSTGTSATTRSPRASRSRFDHLLLNRRTGSTDVLEFAGLRRLPALRRRQRPLLHAALRGQARLRDHAARAERARSRPCRPSTAAG